MLLGLGLVAASFFADVVMPTGSRWTEEDGAKLQKASAELHAANYELPQAGDSGGPRQDKRPGYDPVAAKAKYVAAKEEYEKQTARLEAVRSGQRWLKWGIRLSGILLAAIGTGGYLLVQYGRRD